MIKYTSKEMETITLFEEMTGATVKDCIINDESITLLVEKGDIGLAIGKKGSMINKVKKRLGKEIHVYEYSDDLEEFISNLFYPVEPQEINQEKDTVHVEVNPQERKRAIGRKGKKIKKVKNLVKRHYDIGNIKIK